MTLGGHLSAARAQDALADYDQLPIERWPSADPLRRRASVPRENLSAYDARVCGARRSARVPPAHARPAAGEVKRPLGGGRGPLTLVWIADLTYLRTWEGWLYLAAVQDAFSRRIVRWAMADHMRAEPFTGPSSTRRGRALGLAGTVD